MRVGVERIEIHGREFRVFLKVYGKLKYDTYSEYDRFGRLMPVISIRVEEIKYHWTLSLLLMVVKPLIRLGVMRVIPQQPN